jgi:hypothetical protein
VTLAIIVGIRKVCACQAGLSQITYQKPYPHREGIKPKSAYAGKESTNRFGYGESQEKESTKGK